MKIGIIVHPNINAAGIFAKETSWLSYVREMKKIFAQVDIDLVRIEHSEAAAEKGKWPVDVMVSIGGDGTFLTTARVAATHGITMTGIRVPASPQSKPFLPDVELNDMIPWLVTIKKWYESVPNYHFDGDDLEPIPVLIEKRHFLKAIIKSKDDRYISDSFIAVNEVSIGKSEMKGTVTVKTDVKERNALTDWQDVLSVRCDLTMIATSTGSTGYAMSAGGPLIHPEDASVVCAHVAPIGFGHRPLVLPGKYDIRMTLTHAQNAGVSFDCQNETSLKVGDEIYIERGNQYTILRKPGWSFFNRAKDVLNWGG